MKMVKPVIDILMSVSLLFLMAFQVTGDKYHEWIGAGMLALFLLHNLLNVSWYKALFKGKYSLVRILRTSVNLLLLAAILVTGYSGMVMSRYVFDSIPIHGGMVTARKLHLAGSYWSFVLMSIHLGMHWSIFTGKYMKGKWGSPGILFGMRILAVISAAAGLYFAVRSELFRNMFLQNEFAFLDYETAGPLIIIQNLAMMSTWILTGHYFTKGIRIFSDIWKNKKEGA